MRWRICSLLKAPLVVVSLSVVAALGQSLSVGRNTNNSYWLHAAALQNELATLQVSENLHLWIDVTNDVSQQYSQLLDTSNATTRFYRLKPTPPEAAPIRVMTLGDSMVADCCGWGVGLGDFFKPNVTVLNYAQAWTSTKIFLQSAEYEKMLLVKPNYVLMQFGYSDGGVDPTGDRGSTPQEYEANLRSLVQTIRGFDGVPIMITLHADRTWDGAGNLVPSLHPYNAITKRVAADLNAPLIDLYPLTFDLYSKMGKDGCAFMIWIPGGSEDGMHVSPLGAKFVSQLIARFLPDALGPYLTGVLDPLPKP